MDQTPRPQPSDPRAADRARDSALLRLVLIMVGVLVAWQVIGSLLGGASGFAISVAAGAAVACYLWRERVTFDLVADVALVGLPAVVIGLSLS